MATSGRKSYANALKSGMSNQNLQRSSQGQSSILADGGSHKKGEENSGDETFDQGGRQTASHANQAGKSEVSTQDHESYADKLIEDLPSEPLNNTKYCKGDGESYFPVMSSSGWDFTMRFYFLYEPHEYKRSKTFSINFVAEEYYKRLKARHFLPMPCHPVKSSNPDFIDNTMKPWALVTAALRNYPHNSLELENAIKSYKPNYANQRFIGLHKYFAKCNQDERTYFFGQLLPKIIELALRLPDLMPMPIPLLCTGYESIITMSQEQAACLLANGFLCTFADKKESLPPWHRQCPGINFNMLFENSTDKVLQKLKCIIHYFDRVTQTMPNGSLSFMRKSVHPDCLELERSRSPFVAFNAQSHGCIEDTEMISQIDFANRKIGGGVLKGGCVQEEIRFVLSPELLVSLLLSQILRSDECLVIKGSERFSCYTGYANTFRWSGNYEDKTPRDSKGRRLSEIIAIDALLFNDFRIQLQERSLKREIMKAYCGFLLPKNVYPKHAIATGNWGCGAFGGDKKLKGLIQMIAAAEANRPLKYFTFGDIELVDKLVDMHQFLREENWTVGRLWNCLLRYGQRQSDISSDGLFKFIYLNKYNEWLPEEIRGYSKREDDHDHKRHKRKKNKHDSSRYS